MVLIGTLAGFGVAFGFDVAKQLVSNDWNLDAIDWGRAFNLGIVGAGLGFSFSMGVAYLGLTIAGTTLAGGLSAIEAFGISALVSFATGALGYTVEELFNERSPSLEKAVVHGGFVALEGMVKFCAGGMAGSIGIIGTKGSFASIEWWVKLILGLEFSNPFKYLIDRLRNGIWDKQYEK